MQIFNLNTHSTPTGAAAAPLQGCRLRRAVPRQGAPNGLQQAMQTDEVEVSTATTHASRPLTLLWRQLRPLIATALPARIWMHELQPRNAACGFKCAPPYFQ